MRILILRPDEIMANAFTDGCLSSIIYQDLKRHLDERVKHLLGASPEHYADRIRSPERVLSCPILTQKVFLLPCLILFFIFSSPRFEHVTP
jgi:hypothetical protein